MEIKYPPLLPCYYPVLIPWLQTHSWNTPVLEHVHKCPLGLVKKYHVINTIARSAPAAHTQIHRSACSVLYLRVYFQSHGPNYTESETQYHARTPYMNPSNAPPCTAVQPAPPPPPRAPKDSAHCTLHRPWLTLRRRVRAPVASAETIVGACPVRWRHRVRWRQHHKHARAALD